MEDRNLRSMKACIIDLQMQVTNITNTMNSYDYQVILPNHDIIKEALAELKKIYIAEVVNQNPFADETLDTYSTSQIKEPFNGKHLSTNIKK